MRIIRFMMTAARNAFSNVLPGFDAFLSGPDAKIWVALLGFGLTTFSVPVVAFSDTVQLRNKGVVSGELVPNKAAGSTIVRTYDGILMQLPSTSVKSSSTLNERESAYLKSIEGRPDTALSNREIASECKSREQLSLSKAHLERVVELDPTDTAAWSSLNYYFDKKTGEWTSRDILNKRLGLIVMDNKRMTMHSAELLRARKKIKEDEVVFRRELERAVKNFGDNTKNGEAARAYMAELKDPRANPYLEKLILDAIKARRDPQVEISLLLRMPKGSAVRQLINICRATDEPAIVTPLLEELKSSRYMRETAMMAFVEDLKVPKGTTPNLEYINRAGANLEALGDERIIPSLISRLSTKLLITMRVQPQTGQQHNSNNVSHSTGRTVQKSVVQNHPGVLQALSSITGESFGYNELAWRQWYAQQFASVNLDTRRFDE